MAASSSSTTTTLKEAGIGAAFRFVADSHAAKQQTSEAQARRRFIQVTGNREWGEVGQRVAQLLNKPPHPDDAEAIRSFVGALGFDHARTRLTSPSYSKEKSEEEILEEYEALEKARQHAYEPVAAMVDSSEHVSEHPDQFYKDVFRVADMIHSLHASEHEDRLQSDVAMQMTSHELADYRSPVRMSPPSQLIAANPIRWIKKKASTGKKKVLSFVRGKKESALKDVSGGGRTLEPLKLLSNKSTNTENVHLLVGQIREIVDVSSWGEYYAKNVSNEITIKQFGVIAYHYDLKDLGFMPRSVGPYRARLRVSANNELVKEVVFVPRVANLGYFEKATSKVPFGIAALFDSVEDGTLQFSLPDSASVTVTVDVEDGTGIQIYSFGASTTRFSVGEMIGLEMTDSMNKYGEWLGKNDYSNTLMAEMGQRWKRVGGDLRVLSLTQPKVKALSSTSNAIEHRDYGTVAASFDIYLDLSESKSLAGASARLYQRTFEIYGCLLRIPRLTTVNYTALDFRKDSK